MRVSCNITVHVATSCMACIVLQARGKNLQLEASHVYQAAIILL